MKCGYLEDDVTGKTGTALDSLSQSEGFRSINYISEAGNPATVDTVIIRFSASDASMPVWDLSLYIKPYPLTVTFSPQSISPGDTADIIIKRRMADGTLIDYQSSQLFEAGMVNGCSAGELISGDSAAEYFNNIPAGFKFKAADTLSSDSVSIKIRVGTKLPAAGTSAKIAAVNRAKSFQEMLLSKNFTITPNIEKALGIISKSVKFYFD